jgi:hypothetical protein
MGQVAENQTSQTADMPKVTPPVLDLETFEFQAKVFKVKGAWFQRDDLSQSANFYVPMGVMTACVPISKLLAKFSIDSDEPDGILVRKVEQALKFVPIIRNGDAIPSELLCGKASWSYQPHHRQIAKGRVAWYLLRHGEIDVEENPAPAALLGFADGGLSRAHTDDILQSIVDAQEEKSMEDLAAAMAALADDLAYIEALKEHFCSIFQLRTRFEQAHNACRGDKVGAEEFRRIAMLSNKPCQIVGNQFSKIGTLLQAFDEVLLAPVEPVLQIQKIRNGLHLESQKWQALQADWKSVTKPELDPNIRHRTYHFLASHWPAENQWSMGA